MTFDLFDLILAVFCGFCVGVVLMAILAKKIVCDLYRERHVEIFGKPGG